MLLLNNYILWKYLHEFLLQNNWKPRRENNNPKTIKEIRAEAALEAHEKQMAINQAQIPNRGSQSRNYGGGPPQQRLASINV